MVVERKVKTVMVVLWRYLSNLRRRGILLLKWHHLAEFSRLMAADPTSPMPEGGGRGMDGVAVGSLSSCTR